MSMLCEDVNHAKLHEKEELIAEWKPEPLVPATPPSDYALKPRIITSKVGKQVVVDGRSCLNLASHNYLGMTELESAENAATGGLRRYGVGSCGPPQFFGTIDVHLALERRLADFMGVEEACLYSFGFSTIASAIPSYAKLGDIIFADEDVNYSIQSGLLASQSTVYYFRHNDVEDLERLLLAQQDRDIVNPKKARVTRRFLVVEGIYISRGDICPLPELVKLRRKFKLRLFIDETCSFAVLGRTGRGVREHFDVPVPAYQLAFQALLFLLASAVWLLFRKSPQASAQKSELTEEEKELIANLTLEPLASPTPPSDDVVNTRIINTEVAEEVVVDGHSILNLASHDYLGMAELQGAEKAAIRGHRRYAVGSCGPRQFFGTVEPNDGVTVRMGDATGVHLELERRLAEFMGVEEACLYSFMGVEEACLYSFGFSTIPSVIPSYAKPGDICFADEDVNYAIHMGLLASGSKIYYFRHNDVQDLQRLLLEQQARDIADPKKAGITNRFLVVEGIYASRGDICPLPELVNLRRKFQLRLFIDETCSFAVLGHTGRGVREHFNVPSNEIDLMCATLEHGVGAFGGFFCGTRVVVHDQHLSGLGYFSASLPPEQASVSLQAIDYLSSHPELLTRLRQNCVRMHEQLQRIPQLRLGGEAVSPVKHLYIAGDRPKNDCSELLDEVVRKAWEAGLALTRAPYLEDRENTPKDASIRISVSASLTEEDIEHACDVIRRVCEAVVEDA